jgi:hypothetical protein
MLHGCPVQSDFLFMESVLFEKKVFLQEINPGTTFQSFNFFEKLVREYDEDIHA